VEAEQLLGRVLDRDIAQGEQVDGAIDAFIEKRHQQRVKAEGERRQEELWKESSRRHAEKQRMQARYEWHIFHTEQAARHRRNLEVLAAYHEERAEALAKLPGPEDAA
jgi:selenocysteine-specific translation elongation factor